MHKKSWRKPEGSMWFKFHVLREKLCLKYHYPLNNHFVFKKKIEWDYMMSFPGTVRNRTQKLQKVFSSLKFSTRCKYACCLYSVFCSKLSPRTNCHSWCLSLCYQEKIPTLSLRLLDRFCRCCKLTSVKECWFTVFWVSSRLSLLLH